MVGPDDETGEMLPAPTDSPLTLTDQIEDAVSQVAATVTGQPSWKTGQYYVYEDAIRTAEMQFGIPQDLLARLLYQESHYRPEIISGAKKSPAGAIGIAQFMPTTAADRGVDPYNPWSSITGAASYLQWLYSRLGRWDYALMAYNWGIGRVKAWAEGRPDPITKRYETPPPETQNYLAQITWDVPIT